LASWSWTTFSQREGINSEVRNILDTRTEQWGVEITAVN